MTEHWVVMADIRHAKAGDAIEVPFAGVIPEVAPLSLDVDFVITDQLGGLCPWELLYLMWP